jgi:signal transduction histidine kinase
MRPARNRRPGLRGTLLASVLAALGLVLAALTIGFNVILGDRLDAEATGVVQARASAELTALTVRGNRILLREAPDDRNPDTLVWVFQRGLAIERPRAAAADNRAARLLALRAPAVRDRTGTRLYALPVTQGDRRLGAVVAGVSLAPYQQTRRTALVASIVLALTVLAAAAAGASWLIARALRPVALMTQQAAEWSERDLDRRFSLGPPHDELMQLAFTLDSLLDRLAASLRHEQRLSAELSHELRTPLAAIAAEAQYALRHTEQSADGRAALEQILDGSARMGRTLDTLIAAARAQLNPRRATSDATDCARAAVAGCSSLASERGVAINVHAAPAAQRVAVEANLVERTLAPLVENACHHAAHAVHVEIERDAPFVLFTVQDDGPGVAADELETIFEPGRRSTSANTGTTVAAAGAGLGLALARRLARSAGGDVIAEKSQGGGRFIVRLPVA